VVGARAEKDGPAVPEVWYMVVMKKTKHKITGQYLEEDENSPGGYTLHDESGEIAIETMCFDFGPLDFIKTRDGVLMLHEAFPASGVLKAKEGLDAYMAA
jgi:hypothetical protein